MRGMVTSEKLVRPGGLVVDDPKGHWQVTPHAENYDQGRFGDLWGRVYRSVEQRAIRRATQALVPEDRILDVASGTGPFTALLIREGCAPAGCDFSWASMSVAQCKFASGAFFRT